MRHSKATFVVVALALAAAGCELLVDFDRTLIDGGSGDGAVTDTTLMDTMPLKDVAVNDVVNDTTPPNDSGMDSPTTSDASDASTADADDGASTADADDGAAADGNDM